jgi:prolyl-tRNA editing enzyme YbaK/EbsC (Cys-tRNA(Pro) deacylase)
MSQIIDGKTAAELDSLGIDYQEIPCDPEIADTRDFCAHYGYSLEESANVILIASKKGELKVAACVVLATCRLDVNKTARKKLGVQRISFAKPELTREITGMELGGVTPFGLPADLPVWIDARVMDCERIILGGGNRSSKIIIAPQELGKVPNTEVVANLAYEI